MKTEHTYRWRVVDRGRSRVTFTHLTDEQVRRDYPFCEPEPLLDTLVELEVPETADEMLRAIERVPVGHGTSTCPACQGELWLCVDHRQPWPHEGCEAEGMACACNPTRAVRWREVYADNEEPRTPKQ